VRLAEAQRQQKLQSLYQQAQTAGTNWPAAITALEEIVADMPDYRDAQTLLTTARQQKQLADLYAEALRLHDAGQWQAVVKVFGQIQRIDPNYLDPDELLAAAEREVAELQRQAELSRLYGRAVREIDAGKWDKARQLLATIAEMEPDYRETNGLLARAEEAAARAKAEQERQAQINTWYEQALSLARAGQWPQVLVKMEEIAALDPQFVDAEGIAKRAQVEIEQAALEAQRQDELATLYAEAVHLLKAESYQAALEKWRDVQALDAQYPDRQKVQRTAKKKLKQLSKTAVPRRRWSRKNWLWLGGGVVVVTAVVLLLILNPCKTTDDAQEAVEFAPTSIRATPAAAVAAPGQCPEITAWQAEYWDNQELQGNPVLCRNELAISHNWGESSPGLTVPKDHFSARFTRTINFASGKHRFTLSHDDGVRLWIDGDLVYDQWQSGVYPQTFIDVNLNAGNHQVRLEYFENDHPANVALSWTAVSECAPSVIYCEDFEKGRADNWDLEPGWEIVESSANHYLQGSENSFAILQHMGWADYRLRFRFKIDQGRLQLFFRYFPEEMQWYTIG
ncbi:MAG: hypothetical protein KC413_23900, partial [Anaerolineales bacterium]|nr:hypothetical protein [Anaerolineales bacterium]